MVAGCVLSVGFSGGACLLHCFYAPVVRRAHGIANGTWSRTRDQSDGVPDQYAVRTRRYRSVAGRHIGLAEIRQVAPPRNLRARELRQRDLGLGARAAWRRDVCSEPLTAVSSQDDGWR